MMKKSIKISCPGGLEPRYESKIYLETDTKRVNAKSIMGMMSLNLVNGDLLTVSADGNDEEGAMEEIQCFLKGKLNLVS